MVTLKRFYCNFVIFCSPDIASLQAGMGDKVATFIQWVSTFLIGAVICLVTGWELTLVILCVAPIAAFAGAVVAKVSTKLSSVVAKFNSTG